MNRVTIVDESSKEERNSSLPCKTLLDKSETVATAPSVAISLFLFFVFCLANNQKLDKGIEPTA
jgi:hypothetical protein